MFVLQVYRVIQVPFENQHEEMLCIGRAMYLLKFEPLIIFNLTYCFSNMTIHMSFFSVIKFSILKGYTLQQPWDLLEIYFQTKHNWLEIAPK